MNLNLKKPCANCPFLREGAINLSPSRLAGIIADLAADDGSNFQCHKTVYSKRGGDWVEYEDGEVGYQASGHESMCIGSAIYMLKVRRPSVALRFALMTKMISLGELTSQNDKVIEPLEHEEFVVIDQSWVESP